MALSTAAQTTSVPSYFAGRAVVGTTAPSVGKSMSAVFARIYLSKTDQIRRKLTKKRPVPKLAASISAPQAIELQFAPTPSRGPFHKLKSSSQANPVTADPSHVAPQMQRTDQVRPDPLHSTVHAELSNNQKARRSASMFSSSPSTVIHSNPLHFNPAIASAVGLGLDRRTRGIPQIMGKRYTKRLSRMSILPALSESNDEEQPPTPVVPPSMTALPSPPPRPVAPLNLPDIQRSQSQQLKARNDLVEAADKLRSENAQLSSHLRDAVSQNVVATTQLEKQEKETLALEQSLQALWSLAQPNKLLKTPQICEQVKLLSTVSKSHIPTTINTTADAAALEQKLAQQAQQLAFYKRSNAAAKQLADTLVHENKHMKAQLDKIEAERLRLQASLHAAEVKLERIERSLYVYPSTAQEILSGTASPP